MTYDYDATTPHQRGEINFVLNECGLPQNARDLVMDELPDIEALEDFCLSHDTLDEFIDACDQFVHNIYFPKIYKKRLGWIWLWLQQNYTNQDFDWSQCDRSVLNKTKREHHESKASPTSSTNDEPLPTAPSGSTASAASSNTNNNNNALVFVSEHTKEIFKPGDWIVKKGCLAEKHAIFEGYKNYPVWGWVIHYTEKGVARTVIDLDDWLLHVRPRQPQSVLYRARAALLSEKSYSNSEAFCSYCVLKIEESAQWARLKSRVGGAAVAALGASAARTLAFAPELKGVIVLCDSVRRALPLIYQAFNAEIEIAEVLNVIARDIAGAAGGFYGGIAGLSVGLGAAAIAGASLGSAAGVIGLAVGGAGGLIVGGIVGEYLFTSFYRHFIDKNCNITNKSALEGAYKYLGASPKDSWQTIKKKYHAKARIMHPDKGGDHDDFVVLQTSYALVKAYRESKYGSLE